MNPQKDHQKRKIIHIDMDAFYASVEQRDNPALRGKPIAVGGGESRGVTTTASYEARKFGVRSAMPGFKARQLCPQIIFVSPRFDAYREVSRQIREIFRNYTDLVEPLSLDEAYLDVTDNKISEPIATNIAIEIKKEIRKKTSLSCSAGVSYCKFLAKVASDIQKPDGLTVIKPHQAESFIEGLSITKFFGIGKVTGRKMQMKGIHNGADLKKWKRFDLVREFGKAGDYYYNIARGIDRRKVNNSMTRKSIAIERTLKENLSSYDEISPVLEKLIILFVERLRKAENYGRTVSLKLKTHDFKIINRSQTHHYYIKDHDEIRSMAFQLLEANLGSFESIRLIGLTASNLEKEHEEGLQDVQLSFQF
ncbi:MAG: DNA polymerase IV [Bacteroidia bacterium]|nr:DNA polymerase IV [Bacteroidia bacterium]